MLPTTGTPAFQIDDLNQFEFFAFSFIHQIHTYNHMFCDFDRLKYQIQIFRSRHVASQTTATASGFPKHIKFRATSSSAECAIREICPRNVNQHIRVFFRTAVSLCICNRLSGQFPVCWLRPVKLLNSVLFPDIWIARNCNHFILGRLLFVIVRPESTAFIPTESFVSPIMNLLLFHN